MKTESRKNNGSIYQEEMNFLVTEGLEDSNEFRYYSYILISSYTRQHTIIELSVFGRNLFPCFSRFGYKLFRVPSLSFHDS